MIAPAAIMIYKTNVRIDPTEILPQDIVCCPIEDDQLGKWMWAYWMLDEQAEIVVLDESHP